MTEQLDKDKGFVCPHCGSYCKRYYRKMNSNMALVMIVLFNKKIFGFIKVEEFMRVHGFKRSGDFPYLVHWGFLEKMEGKREDGSSSNGFYKLTEAGREFVLGKRVAMQTVITYNGKFEGFEGHMINIKQALGKQFRYDELMKGEYTVYKQQ